MVRWGAVGAVMSPSSEQEGTVRLHHSPCLLVLIFLIFAEPKMSESQWLKTVWIYFHCPRMSEVSRVGQTPSLEPSRGGGLQGRVWALPPPPADIPCD